jgi:hypothetical protein
MEKKIPVAKLIKNEGQINGLPSNPRIKNEDLYNKLKQSIIDDPEMLDFRELLVYPLRNLFVVIGGNMRLEACIELGYKEIPCKVIPKETPVGKLKAIAIKDNISYGIWDTEKIMTDWDSQQISDWGLTVNSFSSTDVDIDGFFNRQEEDKQPKEVICPHCGKDIKKSAKEYEKDCDN